MSIVISILIFGLIVFIHELGHFLFARKAGILVEEFAIGMGPQIIGRKIGETNYSVRIVPFGGYCKMYGEDGNVEELASEGSEGIEVEEKPPLIGRAFSEKTVGQRFMVIIGGPLFNFILAFFFALIYLSIVGGFSRTIDEVPVEYPAYEAGIRSGDVLTAYNGKTIISASELRLYINNERPELAEITVKRTTETGTEKMTFDIEPALGEDGMLRIGINFALVDMSHPWNLVKGAVIEIIYWVRIVIYSLGLLISGGVSGDDIAGPVGLVSAISDGYSESVQYGFKTILATMSFYVILLSSNLGVMNLLPLPALDGGRLVFIAIEAIRGKPIDPDKEGRVHFIGYVLLMGLMVLVLFNDLTKVFQK